MLRGPSGIESLGARSGPGIVNRTREGHICRLINPPEAYASGDARR